MDPVKHSVLRPFIEGTVEMLNTMVGVPCDECPDLDQSDIQLYISGILTLSGKSNGQIALSFPKKAAQFIVAEILGMEVEELDCEILRDGVGEMVNIVAGNAKSKLSDTIYSFNLSLPSIVLGANHYLDMFQTVEVSRCGLRSEFGDFILTVWLAPEQPE